MVRVIVPTGDLRWKNIRVQQRAQPLSHLHLPGVRPRSMDGYNITHLIITVTEDSQVSQTSVVKEERYHCGRPLCCLSGLLTSRLQWHRLVWTRPELSPLPQHPEMTSSESRWSKQCPVQAESSKEPIVIKLDRHISNIQSREENYCSSIWQPCTSFGFSTRGWRPWPSNTCRNNINRNRCNHLLGLYVTHG